MRFLYVTLGAILLVPVIMLWVKFGSTVYLEMAFSKMSLCF